LHEFHIGIASALRHKGAEWSSTAHCWLRIGL
jgi:hypothetical protein